MALEQKLSLKLAQKLVMTPSLQQAIKLLQMTRMELEGVLNQELVENPVLEEGDVPVDEEVGTTDESSGDAESEEAFSEIDVEAYFGDTHESWEGSAQGTLFEERQGPPLENTLTRKDDLYDQLLWQVHMLDITPRQREIAECIIGNLDPDGFLVATIDEIRAMGADGSTPEQMEAALADALAEQHLALAQNDASTDELAAAIAELHAGEVAVGSKATVGSEAVLESEDTDVVDVRALETPGAFDSRSAAVDAPVGPDDGAAIDGDGADEDTAGDDGAPAIDPARLAAGYSREEVEEALEIVRNLEPPGVACRNLQESLLRQLDARGEDEDSLIRRLVAEKWDQLTHRKFEAIARDFGIPLQELKPMVETVTKLDTRPGRRFDTDRTHYVEPDVHVVKVGDDYVVQLNDNGLPRLRVSRAYRKMFQGMRRQGSEAEARQYIKEKMRSAIWLIKSLDQRQRTIYKVATSIVEQQKAFLENGVDHLRPMVLRDVAEDIGMHESTVSRVVSNKYIHTPRGLLPMKFFFHSGIDREYGGDISSLTVKRKIKQLIQNEDPRKPLSDSGLMRVLKREGINIARRTVAKYRDELGIPSSTERKKIF